MKLASAYCRARQSPDEAGQRCWRRLSRNRQFAADEEYAHAGATSSPRPPRFGARATSSSKSKSRSLPNTDSYARAHAVHLSPSGAAARAHGQLVQARVNSVAYETIREADNSLPLLTPMSEVAGRMAVQVGRNIWKPDGCRGILLGGVPGSRPRTS